ncbi:hypothetical protein M9H77_33214 [Catharanthus roseus]|uniref:Uncharacterized protein n=1 Tax=Catharanthus roseus TaxID=4058 RepID=A0ACB9ZI06_CATRO|nr:hypothetical protein M9H77_33214 [Catharanthus roseus]
MKNFIFLFFSFLSLISFTAIVSSSFTPVDYYLISCGSHEPVVVDIDHRRFTGDSSESGSRFLPSSARSIQLVDENPAPYSSPLYQTARAFKRPSRYVFEIMDKGTHHFVRLHFSYVNSSYLNFSAVKFHVIANGLLLLRDFSAENFQKGSIIKEFIVNVGVEKLEIIFAPSERSKFAFVNAIEVISTPKDLIADLAQYIDSGRNERIDGMLKKGFETVFRVNVGGPKVTPFNDSLWRTWVSDDEYLKSSDGSTKIHFGGRINYQPGGASREVGPDNVYSSARVIKSLNNSVPQLNITWTFPVIEQYNYLIRMHFCDIASVSLSLLYFNVYVNGNLAYENLDLSMITNALLASPFYADFVVGKSKSGILTVSIGPSDASLPHAVDAILNGVEIFKISNGLGSFDGEECVESVMKSWKGGNVGVLLPLLAAVFLLLTASVVVQKKRSGIRDAAGFSRLPLDVSEVNFGSQLSSSKL